MSVRGWFYRVRGFKYDGSKRMWAKARSDCHNAEFRHEPRLNGRPFARPFNELTDKQKAKITFPPVCQKCGEICTPVWKFKHER